MVNGSYEEPAVFENEVRRIARAIWPSAQYSGAAIAESRERDGIFETEELYRDSIHLTLPPLAG